MRPIRFGVMSDAVVITHTYTLSQNVLVAALCAVLDVFSFDIRLRESVSERASNDSADTMRDDVALDASTAAANDAAFDDGDNNDDDDDDGNDDAIASDEEIAAERLLDGDADDENDVANLRRKKKRTATDVDDADEADHADNDGIDHESKRARRDARGAVRAPPSSSSSSSLPVVSRYATNEVQSGMLKHVLPQIYALLGAKRVYAGKGKVCVCVCARRARGCIDRVRCQVANERQPRRRARASSHRAEIVGGGFVALAAAAVKARILHALSSTCLMLRARCWVCCLARCSMPSCRRCCQRWRFGVRACTCVFCLRAMTRAHTGCASASTRYAKRHDARSPTRA
jgi:hypothetical protein